MFLKDKMMVIGPDIETWGKEASKPWRVALGFSLLPNTLHCIFVRIVMELIGN